MIRRDKLARVFDKIVKEAKLDYALTNGICCNTCTMEELTNDYGIDSKGIWVKWFSEGMNKSPWNSNTELFIGHDVTDEQREIILRILREHFEVQYDNDPSNCIVIS